MSLNAALDQKYLPEIGALSSLLAEFIGRWKSATTIEQRLLIEAESVSLFERLINLDIEVSQLSAGRHPELGEVQSTYNDYTYLLRGNVAKLASLAQLYLNHYNTQQLSLMELVGRLKRIRQKYASLTLWSKEKCRFVLSESFLNFDRLSSEFQSAPQCDVNTSQGILTLPVRGKIALPIVKARIGSASNGAPGNSNKEVTTNNTNPEFAINGSSSDWFEYERLDSGPLNLTLVLEFPQEQIVNHLLLEPVNLGASTSFEVDDIIFSTSGKTSTSIRDLVSDRLDKDFFTIKSVMNDTAWTISFLPTRAKTISLKLKTSESYTISTDAGDRTRREIPRERYAIALKTIEAYRVEYDSEGGLNSLESELPVSLFATVPFLDVMPPTPDAFNIDLEVSFDGGDTWLPSPEISDGIGSTVLMQGNEASMLWRIGMQRNNSSFSTLESFTPEEDPVPEINTLLRSVSRFQSPITIPLPEKPRHNRIFAIQPGIARRGDKFNGIRLGEGKGSDISFDIPHSIFAANLLEDVRIFVNKREYTRQPDNSIVGAGEWAFSRDYKQIEFSSDLPDRAQVELVLNKERMLFEERSDGFYHKMDLLFDPDKRNIEISYLPRDPVRATSVLPRDRTLINLDSSNTIEDSFKIVSEQGVTYTKVATKTEVLSTPGSYYIDHRDGVVEFNEATGSDTVQLTYEHQHPKDVDKTSFDSVFERSRPWGIRISKDAFVARTYSEKVSDAPQKRIEVISGDYVSREDKFASSDTAKTLTFDYVVKGTLVVEDDFLNTEHLPKEVDFINGHREFLGLIPMLTEYTQELTASGSNRYVTFNLAAGGLWYKPLDVLFSNAAVFATKVNTAIEAHTGIGNYHISDAGVVTVCVGLRGTLPSGIDIRYQYRDPSFRPANKYSVDYRNGIVYSHRAQNPNSVITYKSAVYKVGYNIADHIEAAFYDEGSNSVTVRTENLKPVNNLVKLIWTKAKDKQDFAALKDYFSPIVSLLGFRFN